MPTHAEAAASLPPVALGATMVPWTLLKPLPIWTEPDQLVEYSALVLFLMLGAETC